MKKEIRKKKIKNSFSKNNCNSEWEIKQKNELFIMNVKKSYKV